MGGEDRTLGLQYDLIRDRIAKMSVELARLMHPKADQVHLARTTVGQYPFRRITRFNDYVYRAARIDLATNHSVDLFFQGCSLVQL